MTFFIVLGMVIMFVVGLLLICGSLIGILFTSQFSGHVSFGEFLVACIMFGLGAYTWYFVFSHVSIGIG